MTKTFTRTLTLTVSAEPLGEPVAGKDLSKLREDAFMRIQRSLPDLLNQGIRSGTLTYQDRSPSVNMHWALVVSDSDSPD